MLVKFYLSMNQIFLSIPTYSNWSSEAFKWIKCTLLNNVLHNLILKPIFLSGLLNPIREIVYDATDSDNIQNDLVCSPP